MRILLISTLALCSLFAQALDSSPLKKKKKKQKKSEVVLANSNDSLSYALGLSIAKTVPNSGIDGLNEELIGQALIDHANGLNVISDEMVDAYIQSEMGKRDAIKQAAKQKEAEIKMAEESVWFAENGKKMGVITTSTGLQYIVHTEGIGLTAGVNDTVKVHYKGMLLDGTVFDSSYEREEPIELTPGMVIPGWTEGLQLMRTGGKYTLYIPSSLGYGGDESIGIIPPYSTLIFEMEVLEIKKGSEQPIIEWDVPLEQD
jgi:FKBP-type peptidyl-prolyl cis-trans isomerase FklB